MRGWLKTGKDRLGVSGKALKSNITDPESVKRKTSKGVIQGYEGMAVVDAKHQIVVHSEAFGQDLVLQRRAHPHRGLRDGQISLRGRRKVNAQWMMYCLAHNIGKIQRYGDIGRWKKERKAQIRQ